MGVKFIYATKPQNIEKEKVEFIYYVDEIDKDYIYLLPNAGYCLGNPPINNRS